MAYVKFFRPYINRLTQESRQEAKELGVLGEQLAAQWLVEHGYIIVERNYRRGKHEVDIIAIESDELVIVEVKTRSSDTFSLPEASVNHQKRITLIRMANQYIRSHHWTGNARFDIVSIVMRNGQPDIKLIKNAFNIMCY